MATHSSILAWRTPVQKDSTPHGTIRLWAVFYSSLGSTYLLLTQTSADPQTEWETWSQLGTLAGARASR